MNLQNSVAEWCKDNTIYLVAMIIIIPICIIGFVVIIHDTQVYEDNKNKAWIQISSRFDCERLQNLYSDMNGYWVDPNPTMHQWIEQRLQELKCT